MPTGLAPVVDGYQSHGNRVSFPPDRHRDRALTGYLVLRLTNDEIAKDLERSLAKVGDRTAVCRDGSGGGQAWR